MSLHHSSKPLCELSKHLNESSSTSLKHRRDTSWSLVFFSSVLAMWSRAYLHSGVMNGVTTGIGGVKRRFAGAPNDPPPT